MNQKRRHVPTSTEAELEDRILESFDAKRIDVMPPTENELYQYYAHNTDAICQYLRIVVDPWQFALNNEIRAAIGHLADYRISDVDSKQNLEKAYGHFRRLTLDAFKILCDEFDKSLAIVLKRQYKYDYRNVCCDYLETYSTLYFKAKNLYMDAQEKEKLGADSGRHNIIEMYHEAAKAYIVLKRYYQNNQEIKKVKIRQVIVNGVTTVITVVGILVTILGYMLE